MSSIKSCRRIQLSLLLLSTLALNACGFHLRRNADLPGSMQRVHLAMNDSNLQRQLARALVSAGANVEDNAGPGIAELAVPTAAFSTDSVTSGGYARVSEYAVRYLVRFSVTDATGQVIAPSQAISMVREYNFDASNPIGNASQLEQIEKSLDSSMVQAIMFRLQAAGKTAVPPAGSAH